ncbi:MAG: carboxypeptidase-like regulatory domain-containing protein, partial [Planctomycetota bacterium]|nr:carboxypeptidase-like regulatory domain-containing protein [Planctomycetota bacterium]
AASGRDTTETAQEPANPVARARRGVVRDADGKPIADASATLLEWRYAVGWKAVRRLAASDAGGRLRFEAPGSRGVRVRISHPNYLRKEQQFDAGSEATVVLERGSPLTVVVRGPDGEPVPGAHVVAHETASAMEWDIYSKRPVLTQEEYCNGVTGETGSCVVGAVPVGHAGIRIEHPRYARHRAWVAVESVDATRHEIVLRYGATVTGRVTGPGGTPVAKARVWIRDHEARFALTDAGGTYELTHVGPGTVHVFAGADGFAPAAFGMSSGWGDAVPVRVADRKTVTGIDVALLLGAHVAGRVVDDTGQPLAGVFVRVRARVEPGGIATVRTGADGAFRAGPLALRAKTGIYVDFATPAMTIPSAHRSLAPGRTLDLGDVVGRRPGRVEGRVEIGWDESRAVYVEAIPAGERYLARTGRVAADGTFSMAVPAGEVAIVARVDGADDVASASRTVKIEANGTTDGVTLTLLRTFPITGRVETADGTPLPNLAVGAYGPDRLAHLTTTDETGAFHFGPLPEGEYKVGVANAARHEVPENTETVPAGARDVKIVVQQPNQKVAGRVLVERTGQPVADFEVSLLRYDTFFPKHVASRRIRSGDGRFTIPADKPGRYAIEIAADDHATHRTPAFRVEADASFEIGDVKVKAPAQLVGVVRNATGLPVPYARVYVVNFKMQANDDAPWTDSNGQYRIPKLDPGAYTLFVVSPRHPLAMVRGVTVTAGEVTERDVALSAASPLLLRIVDAQGAPIKDAALTYTFPGLAPLNSKLLAGYEPPGYGSNRSGADGRIKKPSMPAAIISVTIEKDGFVTGRRDVELVAGEPREVEIRLERKPVR